MSRTALDARRDVDVYLVDEIGKMECLWSRSSANPAAQDRLAGGRCRATRFDPVRLHQLPGWVSERFAPARIMRAFWYALS
jgi:hypothetical protein